MRNERKFYTIVNACVTAVISCAFITFGFLRFSSSYARLKESVFDLFGGALYYFKALFGARDFPVPSVARYSEIWGKPTFAPKDMQGFFKSAKRYFLLLVDGENAKVYFYKTAGVAGIIGKYALIVLPCLLLIKIAIKRLYAKENTKHNRKKTKQKKNTTHQEGKGKSEEL